jgi:uncharacterized protein YbjQ (UPF0145 family)
MPKERLYWNAGHRLLRQRCEALAKPLDRDDLLAVLQRHVVAQHWEVAMVIATTEHIAGYRVIETKGQVFGLVVRSRGLGGNIMAGLRSLGGGEIKEYTELLEEARRHAIDRMVQNATAMGANAITMMRFDSSEIGQTMSEIVAYGTAVVVQPEG